MIKNRKGAWAMIQAIFSDIDGTLLNSKHQITFDTKNTIQKVVGGNIPFVLVSARMPSSIFPLQQELNINAPVICYSGGLILGCNRKSSIASVYRKRALNKYTILYRIIILLLVLTYMAMTSGSLITLKILG